MTQRSGQPPLLQKEKFFPQGTPTRFDHLGSGNVWPRGEYRMIFVSRIKQWDARASLIDEQPVWWKRTLIRIFIGTKFRKPMRL
jgi:hypothetical protein